MGTMKGKRSSKGCFEVFYADGFQALIDKSFRISLMSLIGELCCFP
jgi:hypothetical protein